MLRGIAYVERGNKRNFSKKWKNKTGKKNISKEGNFIESKNSFLFDFKWSVTLASKPLMLSVVISIEHWKQIMHTIFQDNKQKDRSWQFVDN